MKPSLVLLTAAPLLAAALPAFWARRGVRDSRSRTLAVSAAFLVALLAVAATGCGVERTASPGPAKTVTVTKTVIVPEKDAAAKKGVGSASQIVEFGYIKSLERKGSGFELRFDPALLLSGVTAQRAAVEDGVLQPGEPVANDNYVVNDSDRLLTYRVSPGAHVTVLEDVRGTPITVAQLAQIVHGGNPLGRPLFEPISTGFWIAVHVDRIRALDQQYEP